MPLPLEILQARVKNELALCRRELEHEIITVDDNISKFPFVVELRIKKVPGPIMHGGRVSHTYKHHVKVIITEEYPYQKPIVRWQTEIFHPNIMMPDDGGYVCTKLLDDWSFGSNLLSFIKGLEALLMQPNPRSPYKSESCVRASEYFSEHEYKPPLIVKETKSKNPKKRPIIRGLKKE